MRIRRSNKVSRIFIAGVMLLAFAVRALIPQGFMPASDRSFSIEICPEDLPAQLLPHAAHHHHGGGHSNTDHCVFGTAAGNGPPAHSPVLPGIAAAGPARIEPSVATAIVIRLVYLPHARGPPATV